MKESERTILGCLGLIFAIPLLFVVNIMVKGFVISIVWGWFMVPLGLPPVSIAMAYGLAIVISYLTHQEVENKKHDDMGVGQLLLLAFTKPILTGGFILGISWIVLQFV